MAVDVVVLVVAAILIFVVTYLTFGQNIKRIEPATTLLREWGREILTISVPFYLKQNT